MKPLRFISENLEMVNFKQYQEHHYCNTNNCNKKVMLGDGVQPNGDGSADGDQPDDDESDGVLFNMATVGLTILLALLLI